mgnify:CR=1 FL=1
MTLRRGRAFPIILTILLIIIIIYLFANIKQPYVVCTKETTNDLGIEINENIQVTLDGNKIQKMDLTKTLIFPEQYLKQEDNYLNSMHYIIENSYEYLPSDTVTIKQESDRIIANIVVDQDETVILNNIEFENIDDLQIKINSNTKAQDVVTLSINDNYTEGEFMTHMKNNGYTCN